MGLEYSFSEAFEIYRNYDKDSSISWDVEEFKKFYADQKDKPNHQIDMSHHSKIHGNRHHAESLGESHIIKSHAPIVRTSYRPDEHEHHTEANTSSKYVRHGVRNEHPVASKVVHHEPVSRVVHHEPVSRVVHHSP